MTTGKFLKVQVKCSREKDGGVKVRSYHNAGKGNKATRYTKDEIDAIVVVDEDSNKCYWIDHEFFDKRFTKLSLDENKKNVNLAKDFEW